MNRFIFASFILLFLFISFSGCSKPTYLILYNNTDNAIEIGFSGKANTSFRIEKNSRIKILDPTYADALSITIDKKELHYTYTPECLSKEYVEDAVGENRIYYQIEPDGTIYILTVDKINDNFPVKTFPAQPDGFPLRPNMK